MKTICTTPTRKSNFRSAQIDFLPSPLGEGTKKKAAFTLAEVLITLGIIGVVAALTLPALIQNYEKRALQSQFKKSYTVLSNAITKTYADLGYEPACSYGNNKVFTNCIEMHNQMLANLDIIKKCPDHALANGCITAIKGIDTADMVRGGTQEAIDADIANNAGFHEANIHNTNPAYIFNDGSMLMFHIANQSLPLYLVDVNGLKNPNKWGYDIFAFYLNNQKLICREYGYEKGGSKCTDMLLK